MTVSRLHVSSVNASPQTLIGRLILLSLWAGNTVTHLDLPGDKRFSSDGRWAYSNTKFKPHYPQHLYLLIPIEIVTRTYLLPPNDLVHNSRLRDESS